MIQKPQTVCRLLTSSAESYRSFVDRRGKCANGVGHEGTGPWPTGLALPPPPPAGRWPAIRTPAVAPTRGFRRREQDVSSLGPYLVKVFRDSVIRLRGGGGPGSVPGDRAAAAAFLKSASRPPTPGFPLPSQEGPQGWRELGVLSTSIPGGSAGKGEQKPGLRCGRGWWHRALQGLCHFSRPPRC
ncbi:hypothetical protein ACRRTK_022567 [Alexandromys fortis]